MLRPSVRSSFRPLRARAQRALPVLALLLGMAIASGVYAEALDPFSQSLPDAKAGAPKGSVYDMGDHGVSEQRGAATYLFPIVVPPGRNGVAPSLALTYSSGGALRGDVAVGWSMDLPTISVDDTAGKSDVTRYRSSLVGDLRLVSTEGLGDPKAPNPSGSLTESYRAEQDASQTRFQKNKTIDGGWVWEARTSNGMIYSFGLFDGRRWLLTEQRDWLGNTATYQWDLRDLYGGATVMGRELTAITYTSNPGAGITEGHARVEFTYYGVESCPGSQMPIGAQSDGRGAGLSGSDGPPDTVVLSSVYVRSPRRLQKITTKVRDSQYTSTYRSVREYELGYDATELSCGRAAAPHRVLTSITTRGWAPGSSTATVAPVTTFKYGANTRTFASPVTGSSPAPFEQGTYDGESAGLTWQLMDVDGDGRQDKVTVRSDPTRVAGIRTRCQLLWYRGQPGGVFDATATIRDLPTAKWAGNKEVMGEGEACTLSGQVARSKTVIRGTQCVRGQGTRVSYYFLDWDGDHKLDLLTSVWTDNFFSRQLGLGSPWLPVDDGTNGGCPTGLQQTGQSDDGQSFCGCGEGSHLTFIGSGTACLEDEPPPPPENPLPDDPAVAGTSGLPNPGPEGCAIEEAEPEINTSGDYVWRVYSDIGAGSTAINLPSVFVAAHKPLPPSTADSRLDRSLVPNTSLPPLFDIDGDGRLDHVTQPGLAPVSTEPAVSVCLGTGGDIGCGTPGWKKNQWTSPTAGGWSTSVLKTTPTNTTLADMNGDGLPDLVVENSNGYTSAHLQVAWNTGARFTNFIDLGPVGSSQPVELTKTRVDTWAQVNVKPARSTRWASRRLVDVDQDGRPDLVEFPDPPACTGAASATCGMPGAPTVYINLGDRFATSGVLLPAEWARAADVRRGTTATERQNRERWYRQTDMLDWNGDGALDLVEWTPASDSTMTETTAQTGLWAGSLSVWAGQLPSATAPQRLLQEVWNGRGETVKYEYASSTDLSVREAGNTDWRLPQTWLVKAVAVDPGFGQPSVRTEYRYGSPQFGRRSVVAGDPDPDPPQFLGFGVVRTIAPTPVGALAGAQTVHKYVYGVGGDGRGFNVESQLWDGTRGSDKLVLQALDKSTWESKSLLAGKVSFVALTQSEHRVCLTPAAGATVAAAEAQLGACATSVNMSRTTPLRDAWRATTQGPVLLYLETGASSVDSATYGTVITSTTFNVWYGPDYKLFPLVSTTSHYYSDLNSQLIAKSETIYDSKGLPTTSRQWTDATTYRDVVRTFDQSTGNVLSVKKPEQAATGGAATTITYDSHKIFTASTVNELGQSVYTSIDPGTGLTTLTQGPNFRIVQDGWICSIFSCWPNMVWKYDEDRFVYDGLGRETQHWSTYNFGGSSDSQVLIGETQYLEPAPPAGTSQPATMHQVVEKTLRDPAEATAFWIQTKTSVDGSGRVRSVAAVREAGYADAVTTYDYDASGAMVTQTVPSPDVMVSTVSYTFKHDALGRVTELRRPDGTGVDLSYANLSIGAYESATQTTSTEYTNDPLVGGTWIYRSDVKGNLVEVEQQELAALTLYAYDDFDQLIEVTDAQQNITTLVHDWTGQRTKIIRDTRTWQYRYDRNGNVVAEIAPIPGGQAETAYTSISTYDALDRLTEHRPASRAMSLSSMQAYGIGPTKLIYDDASVPNGVGRLTRVEQRPAWSIDPTQVAPPTPPAPIFVADLSYEANGRVKYEKRTFTPPGLSTSTIMSVTREYNTAGNVTRARWDDDQTVFNTYDARGLLQKVEWSPTFTGARTLVADYGTRLAAGQPTQRGTGLGQRRTWSYDKLGRPTVDTIYAKPTGASAEAVFLSRAYTFNGAGDVKTVTGYTRPSAGSTSLTNLSGAFTYDRAHRLIQASESITGQASYTTDLTYWKDGNINTAKVQGVGGYSNRFVRYAYGARDAQAVDSLTSLDPVTNNPTGLYATFQYDQSGNVTRRSWPLGINTDFLWDGDDQLVQATSNQGSEIYHYDQNGARAWARKLSGGAQGTRYWFAEAEQFVPTTGSATRYLYIADGGGVLGRTEKLGIATPTLELHYGDSLQNLALTLKTVGTGTQATTSVTGYFFYGAFGEVLKQNNIDAVYGDTAHRRQFNGKENDTVSQWRYYGARYYDPLMMRWTGADPLYRFAPEANLLDPGRQNLYAFSLNNPVTFVDPDGHDVAVLGWMGVVGEKAAEGIGVAAGATAVFGAAVVVGAGIAIAENRGPGSACHAGTDSCSIEGQRDRDWVRQHTRNPATVRGGGRALASGVKSAGKAVTNTGRKIKNTVASGSPKPPKDPKEPHKNSKDSTAENHRYEIKDSSGDTVKTGISGRPLNQNGTSPRANAQVSKLNASDGGEVYSADVVQQSIPGRAAALEAEQAATNQLAAEGNTLRLQVRPKPEGGTP